MASLQEQMKRLSFNEREAAERGEPLAVFSQFMEKSGGALVGGPFKAGANLLSRLARTGKLKTKTGRDLVKQNLEISGTGRGELVPGINVSADSFTSRIGQESGVGAAETPKLLKENLQIAIRLPDGSIEPGQKGDVMHADIFNRLEGQGKLPIEVTRGELSDGRGFIDKTTGLFYTNVEAGRLLELRSPLDSTQVGQPADFEKFRQILQKFRKPKK